MHEGVWLKKIQNDSYENLDNFFSQYGFCICFVYADQLLPQLLIEQFDTLPSQYRHIEHMHEGVWLKKSFWHSDSNENLDNFPI